MRIKFFIFLIVPVLMFLTGSGATAGYFEKMVDFLQKADKKLHAEIKKRIKIDDWEVDQNLLHQNHIFKSTQAPSFTMKLSDGLKYIGQINYSKNTPTISYQAYRHHFINENKKIAVTIEMVTMDSGTYGCCGDYRLLEWDLGKGFHGDKPWKWDLEKEIHGDKTFFCGTSMYHLKLDKKEREMYKPYDFIVDGPKFTSKIWNYTPGTGVAMGGTRIVIRYFEQGDKTNNLNDFIKRADNRVIFKMEEN